MPNDPERPIGSATQAFLEQLESTSLPLTMLDKAQAYAVCATIEAYNGNTAGAYGILHWFDDHLDTVRAPRPREIARIMNRARARVASAAAGSDKPRGSSDPMLHQDTGFTTPGITRRHR